MGRMWRETTLRQGGGGEEKPITEPNDKRKMGKRGHVKEGEQRVKGEEREREGDACSC